jgi:HSP20 family protein
MIMKLVKYHRPFGAFDGLFEGLNSGLFPAFPRMYGEDVASDSPPQRLPRTNIEETEKEFVFTMEMPGLTKKDVEVSVENETLTVSGEKKVEKEEKKGWLRREIRSMRFERSFSLGNEVDLEKITAKMEDGVLFITLPKKTEKVGRKVDVV